MFYIWHTLLIASFIALAFGMGYSMGKKSIKRKIK
jgi:hypothetical protein